MTKLIDVKEVVANFLTANMFKSFDFNIEETLLEEKLKELLTNFRSLPEKELIQLIKDKVRRRNFFGQFWTLEEVPLKYIGGYPRIGDLPEIWCQSSIVDVAKFIRDSNGKTPRLKSIVRIRQIQHHIKVISKYLFPILLPGGEKSETAIPAI